MSETQQLALHTEGQQEACVLPNGTDVLPCWQKHGHARTILQAAGTTSTSLPRNAGADVSKLISAVEKFTMLLMVRSWATPLSDTRAFMLDDTNDDRRRVRLPIIRFDSGLARKG